MNKEANISIHKDDYVTWLHVNWWQGDDEHVVEFPLHSGMRPEELPHFFREVSEYITVKLKDQNK